MYNKSSKYIMAAPTCSSLPCPLVGNRRELVPKTERSGLRKGAWSKEEDERLKKCIEKHGEGKWSSVPSRAGLKRCRKSCRLRWLNYLSPTVNHDKFNEDEVDLIFRLHKLLGNRWSLIAGRIPGRTANDIKNLWNTYLRKERSSMAIHSPKFMDSKDKPGHQLETKDKGKALYDGNRKTKTIIYRPRPTKAVSFTGNDANPVLHYKEPTMVVNDADEYFLGDLMNEMNNDITSMECEFSMLDDALLLDAVNEWEELLRT